jgi:hypothetical protein
MRQLIIPLITLCSLPCVAFAQSLAPIRAFAFDRGLVDISEPYAPTGNPALLFERRAFRFYAEWQHANINSYLMALSYPLSAKMGLGLAWLSWRTQDIHLSSAAAFNTSYTEQTFLVSFGSRGRTPWGQQIEVTFAANRAALLTGPLETPPPFDNDQSVRLIYRLGFYHEVSPRLAFGLLTPALIRYSYRTFLDSPRPSESRIAFNEPTHTRIWVPRVAMKWQPFEFWALAVSTRSLEEETDAQLATDLRLLKNFNLTAAFARAARNGRAKMIFGLGGNIGGLDVFAVYESRSQDVRLAVSFAPERAKELIEVGEIKPLSQILYPYRLRHNEPTALATIELINKTSKPVETSVKLSGHELPSFKRGMTLGGNGHAAFEVPVLPMMQKLVAGIHQYNIEFVAFQRGRQEIERQLIFEMKDTHDWSGDSRDLNYFVQPADDEILKTARKLLARSQINSRPQAVAECLYNFFRDSLRYVPDPRPLRLRQDRVQYATETLKLKSGDCEDFTILIVSLLESVGIQSAFVDAIPPQSEEGHVFLLFDSQKRTDEVVEHDNLQRYIVRQDDRGSSRLFIPLELTRLEQSFENAWRQALALYQKLALDEHGLAEGWVRIIDTN